MTQMTPDRFERLLRLRGPDLGAWPEHERRAAQRLLARSSRAADLYFATLAADRALETEAAALALPMRARLVDGLRRRLPLVPPSRKAGAFAVPARWATLAACGLLGAWLGWQSGAPQTQAVLMADLQIMPVPDLFP